MFSLLQKLGHEFPLFYTIIPSDKKPIKTEYGIRHEKNQNPARALVAWLFLKL